MGSLRSRMIDLPGSRARGYRVAHEKNPACKILQAYRHFHRRSSSTKLLQIQNSIPATNNRPLLVLSRSSKPPRQTLLLPPPPFDVAWMDPNYGLSRARGRTRNSGFHRETCRPSGRGTHLPEAHAASPTGAARRACVEHHPPVSLGRFSTVLAHRARSSSRQLTRGSSTGAPWPRRSRVRRPGTAPSRWPAGPGSRPAAPRCAS